MANDSVYIVDHREDGLILAKYGENSSRHPHVCCPFCTTDTQIYPVVEIDGVLVCTECGIAVRKKVEKPDYRLFSVNGGKPHIEVGKHKVPTAITGRQFNKGEADYVDGADRDQICKFCLRRYEEDYGGL